MKARFLKYIIPLIIISLAVSCDIIPEDSYLIPIDKPNDTSIITSKRVVLIEDFTGHKCTNCPKAADEVKKLQMLYGDKVIAMAIHSGPYSTPIGAGYTTNYRSPEGNEIHDYFGVQSYPKGMVNRIIYGDSYLTSYGDWESKIAEIIDQEAIAHVEFTQEYNYLERSVKINVKTNIQGEETIPTKLCAFILESGMVSPQASGSEVIEDYVHNHVLRTSFEESGTWGLDLKGIGEETNTLNVTLKENWMEANCEIVVYVYNTQTMEILQAAALHVDAAIVCE